MYESCSEYELFYTYDENGFLSGIKRIKSNGSTENYGVHCNIFGDVVSIYYEEGMLAGGIVQRFTNTSDSAFKNSNYDDPYDQAMIRYGCILWDKGMVDVR